jgi:hypothetical protein
LQEHIDRFFHKILNSRRRNFNTIFLYKPELAELVLELCDYLLGPLLPYPREGPEGRKVPIGYGPYYLRDGSIQRFDRGFGPYSGDRYELFEKFLFYLVQETDEDGNTASRIGMVIMVSYKMYNTVREILESMAFITQPGIRTS